MSYTPLISVLLPNYNHGQYLAEALEGILTQTYKHFEIIFVEDGSTDNSRSIAQAYAAKDNRIRPVYFEKNQGTMAAVANMWPRIKGEVIYQYASDDAVISPDFFAMGVKAMNDYPQIAGFFGVSAMVSAETGKVLGAGARSIREGYIPPLVFLQDFLHNNCFAPGVSSLWKRSEIDAVGGCDPRLGPMIDHFLNHALPSRKGVVFRNVVVAKSRIFAKKQSYSANTSGEEFMQRLVLFASKLKEATKATGATEDDWAFWRQSQARMLINNFGSNVLQTKPMPIT